MAWATLNSDTAQDTAPTASNGNARASTKGRRSSWSSKSLSSSSATTSTSGGHLRSAKKRGNAHESREVQTEKALELYRRYLLNPNDGSRDPTNAFSVMTAATMTTPNNKNNNTSGTTYNEDILENLFQSDLMREVLEEARDAVDDSYHRLEDASPQDDASTTNNNNNALQTIDLQSRPAQFLAYAVLVNMAKRVEADRSQRVTIARSQPGSSNYNAAMDVDSPSVVDLNSSNLSARLVDDPVQALSKEPLELYTNAALLDPSDPFLWYRIGSLHLGRGDFHKAALALECGYRQGNTERPLPYALKCLSGLCEVLFLLGDRERCVRFSKKALSVDPSVKRVQELLRSIENQTQAHVEKDRRQVLNQVLPPRKPSNTAPPATEPLQLHLKQRSLFELGHSLIQLYKQTNGEDLCRPVHIVVDDSMTPQKQVILIDDTPMEEASSDTVLVADEAPAKESTPPPQQETVVDPEDQSDDTEEEEEEEGFRSTLRSSTRSRLQTQQHPTFVSTSTDGSAIAPLLNEVEMEVDLVDELDQMLPDGLSLDRLDLSKLEAVTRQAHELTENVGIDTGRAEVYAFNLLLRKCLFTIGEHSDLMKKPSRRGRKRAVLVEVEDKDEEIDWLKLIGLVDAVGNEHAAVVQELEQTCKTEFTTIIALALRFLHKVLSIADAPKELVSPATELLSLLVFRGQHFCDGLIDLFQAMFKSDDPAEYADTALNVASFAQQSALAWQSWLGSSSVVTCSEEQSENVSKIFRDILDACSVAFDHFCVLIRDRQVQRQLEAKSLRISSAVALSLDNNSQESEEKLQQCRAILSSLPPKDGFLSLADLDTELRLLQARNLFHEFLEDYYDVPEHAAKIIKALLPVFSANVADGDNMYKMEFERFDHWQQFRLSERLLSALESVGRKEQYWRCLVNLFLQTTESLFDAEHFSNWIISDWDDTSTEATQSRFDISIEVLRRFLAVSKLLHAILEVLPENPKQKLRLLDDSVRQRFVGYSFLLLQNAWFLLGHNKTIQQAASRYKSSITARDVDDIFESLHVRITSKETVAAAYSALLRGSVRPFVLFFHLHQADFGMSWGSTNSEVSLVDYFVFAHEHLGEAGLCGEDDARLLRVAIQYISSVKDDNEKDDNDDEEENEDDEPLKQAELFQCYYCLYGVKLCKENSTELDEHPSITKCVPLPFDESAASSIFSLIDTFVEDRLHREQLVPREYQDIIKRLETIFEDQKNHLVLTNACIRMNRANVDMYITRQFTATDAIQFAQDRHRRPPLAVFDVFKGRQETSNEVPLAFKSFFYLKARMNLIHALKTATNNEPIKKESRISAFEAASTAFKVDLYFNPVRLESWYGIVMARLGIIEEMLTWSAHYITSNAAHIASCQRYAFWCLLRCVDLCEQQLRGKEILYHPLSFQHSDTSVSDKIVQFQNLCGSRIKLIAFHSELGYLLYSMCSRPMAGLVSIGANREKEVLAKIVAASNASGGTLETPFDVIKSMAANKDVILLDEDDRPVLKRRRGTADGEDADDGPEESATDTTGKRKFKLAKLGIDTRSLCHFPSNVDNCYKWVSEEARRAFYSFAAFCFHQCRRQLKYLNQELKSASEMQHQHRDEWKEQWPFSSRSGRSCPSSALVPKHLYENWDWLWMLGKCSAKLQREPEVVLNYYHTAIRLARPDLLEGAVLSRRHFGGVNEHAELFGLPRGTGPIPSTFLSAFSTAKVSSVGLKESDRPLMDPVYHWLSYLSKCLIKGSVSEEKLLEEVQFVQLPSVGETLDTLQTEDLCSAGVKRLLELFRRFRIKDDLYHRLVYRNAWLLQQLALRDQAALAAEESPFLAPEREEFQRSRLELAKSILCTVFQLKTKLFHFWVTPNERPGKYYVYGHFYISLLLDLCFATKDRRVLESVVKKVKKVVVAHEFLWSKSIRRKALNYSALLEKEDGSSAGPSADKPGEDGGDENDGERTGYDPNDKAGEDGGDENEGGERGGYDQNDEGDGQEPTTGMVEDHPVLQEEDEEGTQPAPSPTKISMLLSPVDEDGTQGVPPRGTGRDRGQDDGDVIMLD